MARPRRTESEEVLAETRQRLLDAAATEFAREGFAGANINRISKAAGFAKGTIYNYFPSKRELMLALIDEIAAAHTDDILQRAEPEDDPVRRLQIFFDEGFAFVERQPAQAQLVINAVYGPDARLKGRVYQAYERLFDFLIQDVVEAGTQRGDFRQADPDLITALIMAVYLGSCSQADSEGKVWIGAEQVVRFILDGLRPRGSLESEA